MVSIATTVAKLGQCAHGKVDTNDPCLLPDDARHYPNLNPGVGLDTIAESAAAPISYAIASGHNRGATPQSLNLQQ